MTHDVVIVGAGVAGLACGRELAAAGAAVVVLEKSRGVGGRCATRRLSGQPVDHGLAFLHGRDPEFLAALDEVDAEPVPGWPARVVGSGPPCQPRSFDLETRRLAFVDGVNAFPKHLARGLDVRRETQVAALDPGVVRVEDGTTLAAGTVVVALPPEQALALVAPLSATTDELRGAASLLGMAASLPCLTVLAAYAPGTAPADWDARYPEDSALLQLLSHDSAKRAAPERTVLVLQAHAAWSRGRLEHEPTSWTAPLLAEAGRIAGPWAARPQEAIPHRWRFGRADRATEFARPLLVGFPGGARLGVTGDLFHPGGGAEAAWLAGRALARRILVSGDADR